MAHLATLICCVGVAGLFWLDRDGSVRTSKALWIPICWIAIVGSRPVSVWLGMPPPMDLNTQLDGSPIDRLVYQFLLVAGIAVLISRRKRVSPLLKASIPILFYFGYCLVSVLWSDLADVSLKRWIKGIGDLVMVLVVVTDAEPLVALRRLLSRLGFVLVPISILFIHYFADLGHGYTMNGLRTNTGVTTNKNSLGVITFALALGALWQVLKLFRDKKAKNRGRHLLAWSTFLLAALVVLKLAHSATSQACFAMGALLIFSTSLPAIRRRPGRVHALVLVMLIVGSIAMLSGGEADLVHALGRNTNLTGRTEIWKALIPEAPNRLIGAGYETFWIGPWMQSVRDRLGVGLNGINEAHNGYIEVYLNLGWAGVCLIATVLLSGYTRAVAAYRRNPEVGNLMLAYVVAAVIYSITEAGFRLLSPIWIFLLLAIVMSISIASGKESVDRQECPRQLELTSGEAVEALWEEPARVET